MLQSCTFPAPKSRLCFALSSPTQEAGSRKKTQDIEKHVIWVYLVPNTWPTDSPLSPPMLMLLMSQMQLGCHRQLQSRRGGKKMGFFLIEVENSEVSIK